MARRPTLSPSKLSCYLACPHRYYWTYESGQGQWFLKTRSYYAFGLSLHRALEAFHATGESGLPSTETLLAAFDEKWIDAGYASADEMQAAYGEGKEILERFAESAAGAASRGKVLHVEKSLRKEMGEWDLIGRADRIDEVDDAIVVVDYKSGRTQVTPHDVAEDIAMGCYALMTRDLYPGRPVAATLYALRSGAEATHTFSDPELDEIAFAVRELGDRVRTHYWEEFHPKPKGLCASCEFAVLCRRDPEYVSQLPQVS